MVPKFSDALFDFRFVTSQNDTSMFTYTTGKDFLALLVYVDDILLTGTSELLMTQVKEYLNKKFSIKDLGHIHYFLGIEVARSVSRIVINQRKYAIDIIHEAGLARCKPSVVPMDPKHKFALSTDQLLEDPTPYRRLVGRLIYLTVTRPDTSYAVHVLSQFMNSPTQDHLQAAHKVLRYLKNAPAQGLYFSSKQDLSLTSYCDSDWGSCPITRRSVTALQFTSGTH